MEIKDAIKFIQGYYNTCHQVPILQDDADFLNAILQKVDDLSYANGREDCMREVDEK